MLTRQNIASKVSDYMNHRLSLAMLIDWAETSIMNGDTEQGYSKVIMQALGRIAAADVKEFGLLWEDCDSILSSLGFTIKVEVDKAA